MTYIIFAVRSLLWHVGNVFRRIGKPPEYIGFILEGDYPEVPSAGINPLIRYLRPPRISLLELSEQIRTVAADPRVKGVVIQLRPLTMPLARVDVLRSLFFELKSAGKEIVTWSYTLDTTMYYLASASDRILLQPGGSLEPMGLYRQYTYLADAFSWVGVQADFIQISPFKSAGDGFARRNMSDEVREMGNWLADETYSEILAAVSEGRNVDLVTARTLLDQTPCTDQDALELGFVDELLGEDGIPELLGEAEKPARMVQWKTAQSRLFRRPLKKPGKYISLMTIDGLIVDGRSGSPPVEPPVPVPILMDPRAGDLTIVQTARQIQTDNKAMAVVVYVDSRGGSATASESIRLALEKLAATKPMVVVMGSVAASGGYWVSIPGKKIIAQPNTVTGSIGVLAGKIANTGFVERLLIHQEVISRGENVAIFRPDAPFTQAEHARVLKFIQHVYGMFLERVVEGRQITPDALESIAGGRVWTGRQAVQNGLVDELGGLEQAFIQARELAGLDERTPVRIISPGKQTLPPVPKPASWLRYAYEHLGMFRGRAMCILPWIEKQ